MSHFVGKIIGYVLRKYSAVPLEAGYRGLCFYKHNAMHVSSILVYVLCVVRMIKSLFLYKSPPVTGLIQSMGAENNCVIYIFKLTLLER